MTQNDLHHGFHLMGGARERPLLGVALALVIFLLMYRSGRAR